ncbi:MAG TPA: BatD family protein [Polyangiaceae bacterium]|nr:BatD family protein [Polyangiaceae bacterium]
MRLALTTAVAAVGLAATSIAFAVEVQTAVSARRVGVGDTFIVQLTAMSDGSAGNRVSDARLPLPPGMTAAAPNASPQSQVSIVNGQMSQHTGVIVTWTVTANKVGSFRVGPPSVTLGVERAQGSVIAIEVVPAGANPGGSAQRQRRNFDPFNFMDPFGNGSPFGNSPFPPGFNFKSPFDDDEQEQQEPTYPPELRVDKAPDPIAFLRATVTPDHVVVGQQVTLRIFAYGGRGNFSPVNPVEPSHADFLAFDAKSDPSHPYLVPIGDTRFIAGRLEELPLFPLHAGTLRAGDMKMGFGGRGYPQTGPNLGLVRESNWVDVFVTEPPLRGRPAGYKIGDVGNYKLTASVEPREIMAGESIAVVATLSGVGDVPFKLLQPERSGVEWLEPSLSEKMEAPGGVVQGTRTFSYVVRLGEAGSVDLGELTLPYYDPKRHDYAIARAALGTINVKPNPNAKVVPPEQKQIDRLAGALQARDHLGPFAGTPKPLSDRPGFFGFLLLAPFGVVLVGGALSAATRAREKLRVRGTSLSAQLESALRDAKAQAKSDPSATVNAVERAVFLAIELKLGLKARAVLKTELAQTLIARGLPEERARALAGILEDGDALRFVGTPSGVDPTELAQRTEANVIAMRSDKLKAES